MSALNTHVSLCIRESVFCFRSAGIGRTGTFLALDYLMDQAQVEGYVNVFQCAQNLRHQRVNMIQNQVSPSIKPFLQRFCYL